MSAPQREAPRNLDSLQTRIRNVANDRGQPFRRIQRAVASTVVGQVLPDGVVKGGTAMKIRVGEAGSRYTPDFDASRSRNVNVDDYVERLRDGLERGWCGFSGTVRVLEPREVEDVPPDYLMQPFEIRLAYAPQPRTRAREARVLAACNRVLQDRVHGRRASPRLRDRVGR